MIGVFRQSSQLLFSLYFFNKFCVRKKNFELCNVFFTLYSLINCFIVSMYSVKYLLIMAVKAESFKDIY